MTESRDDYVNRMRTANDEKLRILDLSEQALVPPNVGIFDAPTRCYIVNKEWAKIVMGAISANLLGIAAWRDATDESYSGIRAVEEFLQGANCVGGDCTIAELLADDDFFYNDYLPATIGTTYTNTQTHNTDLATDYDGTPQSIGSSIPVGAPNDAQKNALCYALDRFVKLYCSEKICVIQSRNFLEVSWDAVKDAAEQFYGTFLDQMLGNWSDNLFGCIIDVPTALTVLADAAAQEDLACYLLDQLDSGAISESAFNTAIDNAAIGGVSGNAQKIACVMTEDNAQFMYLNFLEAYNRALISQSTGGEIDCPCLTESYRIVEYDFAQGLPPSFRWNYGTNIQFGSHTGARLQGTDAGDFKIIQFVLDGHNPAHRIRAVKLYLERVNGIGNGSDDVTTVRLRPNPDSNTSVSQIIQGGFQPNGIAQRCGFINASPFYATNIRQIQVDIRVTDNATSAIYLSKMEIQYYDGYAPSNSYPTADSNICL